MFLQGFQAEETADIKGLRQEHAFEQAILEKARERTRTAVREGMRRGRWCQALRVVVGTLVFTLS